MNKKILLVFFTLTLFLSILFGTKFLNQAKSQTIPKVYMTYPNTSSIATEYYARLNDTVFVKINVDSPDIGIWSWQVGIYFNNTVLECNGLGNGNFFGGKYALGFQSGTVNNDSGNVTISGDSLRLPETIGVTGIGTLMWFEFHVKEKGTSLLSLTLSPPDLTVGTKLNQKVDSSIVPVSPIDLYDGNVTVVRMGDLGGSLPPEFFKFDGEVDGKDLALFIQAFKGLAPPEAMYLADLGGGLPPEFYAYDGKVDGKDLALFLLCYKGLGPDT